MNKLSLTRGLLSMALGNEFVYQIPDSFSYVESRNPAKSFNTVSQKKRRKMARRRHE